MLPLVVLPLLLLTTAPALHVPSVEAEGSACAAHEALARAVTDSLPGVLLQRDAVVTGEDLLITAQLAGDAWWLEVRRADGSPLLRRTLPREGRSCEVLADASVLILEHHLREIAWSGQPEVLERLPEVAVSPPAQPEAPVLEAPAVAVAPVAEPGRPEAPAGVGLLLAPGVGMAPGVGATPALLAHARLGPLAGWKWGLLALVEWPHARAVEVSGIRRGTLHSHAVLATASAGPCLAAARLEVCGAALAGAWWLRGWAEGTLYQQRTASLLLPALGAATTVALALGPHWAVEAQVGAVVPLGSGALEVSGTEARHAVPLVHGMGALGARWRFP